MSESFHVELLSNMQELSSFCWVIVQTKEMARNIWIVCIQIICIVAPNYKYSCASTNWEKFKKGFDTWVGLFIGSTPTIFVALSPPLDSPHSQIWENRAVEFVKKDISRNCYWEILRGSLTINGNPYVVPALSVKVQCLALPVTMVK